MGLQTIARVQDNLVHAWTLAIFTPPKLLRRARGVAWTLSADVANAWLAPKSCRMRSVASFHHLAPTQSQRDSSRRAAHGREILWQLGISGLQGLDSRSVSCSLVTSLSFSRRQSVLVTPTSPSSCSGKNQTQRTVHDLSHVRCICSLRPGLHECSRQPKDITPKTPHKTCNQPGNNQPGNTQLCKRRATVSADAPRGRVATAPASSTWRRHEKCRKHAGMATTCGAKRIPRKPRLQVVKMPTVSTPLAPHIQPPHTDAAHRALVRDRLQDHTTLVCVCLSPAFFLGWLNRSVHATTFARSDTSTGQLGHCGDSPLVSAPQ